MIKHFCDKCEKEFKDEFEILTITFSVAEHNDNNIVKEVCATCYDKIYNNEFKDKINLFLKR